MSTHGHTTIRNPTSKWSPPRPMDRGRGLVLAVGLLAALSLLTAAALVVRLAQLGWVVGEVATATTPALAALVRQKTVLVTAPISAASSRPGRPDASATTPGWRSRRRPPVADRPARASRPRPGAWKAPKPGTPPGCWPASTHGCTACWCR